MLGSPNSFISSGALKSICKVPAHRHNCLNSPECAVLRLSASCQQSLAASCKPSHANAAAYQNYSIVRKRFQVLHRRVHRARRPVKDSCSVTIDEPCVRDEGLASPAFKHAPHNYHFGLRYELCDKMSSRAPTCHASLEARAYTYPSHVRQANFVNMEGTAAAKLHLI
jgi:hypothetical protein